MANPFQPTDQGDDPLGLFEPEEISTPAPVPAAAEPRKKERHSAPESASVRVTVDLPPLSQPRQFVPDLFRPPAIERAVALEEPPRPVLSDVSVEVLGPPPPAGSVSFDHVCSVKGLGFVEGVALIQGVSDALEASGPNTGVPELHGLYLTETGDVVLHGAPTGEPPARELARLLHQLVAPNLMPPAGRLFVGRWVNNDVGGLTEFRSELSYFARPNGQELLVGLHGRCDGITPRVPMPVVRPQRQQRQQRVDAVWVEPEQRRLSPVLAWIRSHKPEMTALVAVVASAAAAGFGTWLWYRNTLPESSAKASISAPAEAQQPIDANLVSVTPPAPPQAVSGPSRGSSRPPTAPPPRASRPRSPAPPPGGRRADGGNQPPVVAQSSGGGNSEPAQAAVALPLLTSGTLPDLRIYSAADAGVEPPRLRSAQILEVLLKDFEKRENLVELVVSERGDVQQARMVGAPQRMPDIMLISRAKQLQFDPAVRNGVPVRYRVRLSWNVTP